MTGDLVLVIDAGTTSTRALLFDRTGRCHAVSQREFAQFYPEPGRVEHDAAEIWTATLACMRQAAGQVGAERIASIGVTNQRETVVAWDRIGGEPLARAIVWQDRRTAPLCEKLRSEGAEPLVQAHTGLLLDPYFSGTKMRWLLDDEPAAAQAAREGRLALGTVESWLVWKLTGGSAHVTDASNASRTLLLALDGADWDDDLLALFGVPRAALPQVVDSLGEFGTALPEWLGVGIPVRGLAGDQQAATIGQGCLAAGQVKATYGTGAFVLATMGDAVPRSGHRLLGTVLMQQAGRRSYALEGSVFVAGSLIKWLRDSMGLIASADETAALASSVPDSGGVVLVPALSGLGAPHWRPDATAALSGMTFATTRAHIARAALEAMAHQTHDLMAAFAADRAPWSTLRIDGGMSSNDWMAQDLADLLDLPVERPAMVETTALGAGMLAATASGWFASLDEAATAMRGPLTRFEPQMPQSVRDARIARWKLALGKV
ncbi:glycerol kinase GlpK [Novosphingobium sp. SL115]|uniref:glycerol kinase GlpK n=1 Tax=Novosphingobium sp. SL115 TaxID=2995150 RepID=UPI0022729040|nr:glycerol kinase GlpK [Novosphingobium sp. SL115]MCY1670367.1 glycerol kinase GlpK [Novosphingobium sp. SL115]